MTFNTGNPIGSTDARDLSDNAENFDKALGTLDATWTDRLGVTRDSFEGRLAKGSFYRVGTFAAGYRLTNMRQTLEYNGHEYSWAGTFPKVVAAGSTPATSGGIGAGAWVDRSDVTLRSDLNIVVKVFASVADMVADTKLSIGDKVRTLGYYTPGDGGANDYEIVAAGTGVHDGGSYIDLAGSGLQAKGLFPGGASNSLQYGAYCNGVNDDTIPLRNLFLNGGKIEIIKPISGSRYRVTDGIEYVGGSTIIFQSDAYIWLSENSSNGYVIGPGNISNKGSVLIINPHIDGGELGHIVSNQHGENGIGIAKGYSVTVIGGKVTGCRRGTDDFGGKGVQVEDDVDYAHVGGGIEISNCTKGFNTQGVPTGFGKNVLFSDIVVKNCAAIFQLDQFYSPPVYSGEQQSVTIDNIRAYNCGKKDYTLAIDTGAIVINRYSNASIGSVSLVNEISYGEIPSLITDHQGVEINILTPVVFNGDAAVLVDMRNNSSFGTGGTIGNSNIRVSHYGTATTLIRSDTSASISGMMFDIETTDALSTLQLGAITGSNRCYAIYKNIITQCMIAGTTQSIQNSGLDLTTTERLNLVDGAARFGQFLFVRSTQDRINNQRDADIQIQRNGSTRLQLKSNTVSLPVIPLSSAGLSTGDLWSDAGVIKRVP